MNKLTVLLLLLFNFVYSSVPAQKAHPFRTDNSVVKLRSFDKTALNEYRADKHFQYGEVKENLSPSLWDQFWNWFWSLFRGTMSNAKSGGIFKYIFLILGCVALIFIVVKLSGMDYELLFTGRSKGLDIDYSENMENIHVIHFDDEINKALQNKNYRLAVRLLYLKLLKRLNDSGRIKWEADKTNSTYINELQDPLQREKFRLLTLRFEYVWYGSFPVDGEAYHKINNSFSEFYSIRG